MELQTKSKPWMSKTIWFGVLTSVVASLLPMFPALEPIQKWMADNMNLMFSAWGLIAVILRIVTKDKISLEE